MTVMWTPACRSHMAVECRSTCGVIFLPIIEWARGRSQGESNFLALVVLLPWFRNCDQPQPRERPIMASNPPPGTDASGCFRVATWPGIARRLLRFRHTFEHCEVAHRVTVVLGFFLQHYLEAAAHDVLLVGIHVRWLATARPVELGRSEPVDDTPHRGHAGEPRREHLVERRDGVKGEAEPRRSVGWRPPGGQAQRMVGRFLLEHGIAEPGIACEKQMPLCLDQRPLAVDLLVQFGLGQ